MTTKLCPDCGQPMVLAKGTFGCIPCDVYIDGRCEQMDAKLTNIDMDRLYEEMSRTGKRSMTLEDIEKAGLTKR